MVFMKFVVAKFTDVKKYILLRQHNNYNIVLMNSVKAVLNI